ncbi:MAG: hypothetical protein C0390_00170 [Syntrophus sp. (in: bacteria)]|nr:hypothetical protein [Syntrophus sp. (in: bacteria)]
MQKRINWVVSLVMSAFIISGCELALIGVGAVGAGSGTYFYINGDMKTDYYHSFDATWSACQKSIADMRGVDVEQDKEIGNGKISAVVNDEKVKIEVLYKAKNVTTVSVRVGLIGDKLSSQLIHDKIGDNLVRK